MLTIGKEFDKIGCYKNFGNLQSFVFTGDLKIIFGMTELEINRIFNKIHKPPLLYLRFGKSRDGSNKWLFALLIAPYDRKNRLDGQGFKLGNYRAKLRLFGKDLTKW